MSLSTFKISTHVLDTSKGCPVCDLPVKLYKLSSENEWTLMGEGKTTATGRIADFVIDNTKFSACTYKLNFTTNQYYNSLNEKTMYPFIDIIFGVDKPEHYHIPLLLNAFGFTTYRGS